MKEGRRFKKEYVGVVMWITYIGTRGGIKEYAVDFYDGHEEVMDEIEIQKLFIE